MTLTNPDQKPILETQFVRKRNKYVGSIEFTRGV